MSSKTNAKQVTDDQVKAMTEKLTTHFSQGGSLRDVAGITQEDLEAIYAMAYNLVSARKFEQAEQLFRFLCMYDHLEQRWWNGLGVTLQNAGKHAEAVNAYAMATILDVNDPRPQAQAGYCLAALQRWKEAADALGAAVEICADKPELAEVKVQAAGLLEKVQAKAK